MYEMHAETLADDSAALRWHAVRPGGTRVAVCGRPVPPLAGPSPADASTVGELCGSCMDEIASAMEGAGAP